MSKLSKKEAAPEVVAVEAVEAVEAAVEAPVEATDKITIKPDLEKYTKAKSSTGAASMHNGDVIATELAGATVREVSEVAVKLTGNEELETKYNHLNIGQQRMNLGNRIRGMISKIDKANGVSIDKHTAACAAAVEAGDDVPNEPSVKSGIDTFLEVVSDLRPVIAKRVAEKAADAKVKAEAAKEAKAEKEAKAKKIAAAKEAKAEKADDSEAA